MPLRVLDAVEEANDAQKHRLFEKLQRRRSATCADERIAVWGLAFKPNTDDMREAPSLVLIERAARRPAPRWSRTIPSRCTKRSDASATAIAYAETNYDALDGRRRARHRHRLERVPASGLRAHQGRRLKTPVVVDGRNLYDRRKMAALGFTYASIGRGGQS